MPLELRDQSVIRHMIQYCDEITFTLSQVDNDHDHLLASSVHVNALALCILQIGELSTVLSDEFKDAHPEMPWRDIKRMRNIVAHHYGSFNREMLWNTVQTDIPQLRQFCEDVLKTEEE